MSSGVVTPKRILLVEDEPGLALTLTDRLVGEGYQVETAGDGDSALERGASEHFDLIVLDVMLPRRNGFEVCRGLRERGQHAPVIMLTARGHVADKVAGLKLGADDYVTKPFSVRELVSRVRANLRRTQPSQAVSSTGEILRGGPVEMDVARHEVRIRGELTPFALKEFDLLEALLSRKGRLATRELLIEEVWGADYVGDTKTLDVHVKRVRRKIEEDPHHPAHLVTVRGLGYRFVD